MCDIVYLNPALNAKYWLISMNKEGVNIIVRLKKVLLPIITMMKIDKNNEFPKRCNKKQAETFGTLRIRNYAIDRLLEEIFRNDNFDTEF